MRIFARLTGRPGRLALVGMLTTVVLLLGSGFGLLLAATPLAKSDGPAAFGMTTGVLALTLGMRHAFDADHIAAIDNTTRKLVADGRRPVAVGYFFSLGHCTIVLALTVLLGFAMVPLGSLLDDGTLARDLLETVGTIVSGSFLYLIAGVNIVLLLSMTKALRRARRNSGTTDGPVVDTVAGGLFTRVFGRLGSRIDRSWKIFPIGLLFGLGFDTATEIGLLVIAASTTVSGLPFWATLSLPLLFAGGMCLFDSLDGLLMNAAYGWASAHPSRRSFYNIVVTAVSIAVAFLVATAELGSLAANRLGWQETWTTASLDPSIVGLCVVALLVALWVAAVVLSRMRRAGNRGRVVPSPE